MFLLLATASFAGSVEIERVHIERLGRGPANAWLVTVGDEVMLVDAHYGDHPERLLKRVVRSGVDARDVDLVVVTHADESSPADASRSVTGATVVVLTVKDGHPRFEPDMAVTGTLDLHGHGIPGTVTLMGGHTPGALIVTLDSGDVFVDDLLRSRIGHKPRPTGHLFQDDIPGAHDALQEILDAGARRLYPSHGGSLDADDVQCWLDRTEPEPPVVGASGFWAPALFHLFFAQRR